MRDWLDAVIDPNRSAQGHVAVENAAVIGFGLLETAGRSYTRDYLGLESLGVAPQLADRNGIFHMYCVHTDHEGRGVGTALYARHVDLCVEESVTRAFGIAWHRSSHSDSRPLFEHFGFRRLGTFQRFYQRTESRVHCPDCGGPCTCTASLYVLSLGGEEHEE